MLESVIQKEGGGMALDVIAPWGEYVPGTERMTVAHFEALPDVDGWIFELHQGRMIRSPGPGYVHATIHTRLMHLLYARVPTRLRRRLYGMVCCALPVTDGETVLCPDLAYVRPERDVTVTAHAGYLTLAPDWVIEIASPNDYCPQLQRKMQVYLAAGVRLGWVIWPNSQTVEIWRPGDTTAPARMATPAETLDGADVVPDLRLPVTAMFDV